MFGNCCGRNKKAGKVKTSMRDAETQSTNDILNIVESNFSAATGKPDEAPALKITEFKDDLVTDQPKITDNDQKQSIVSNVKIEIPDEDDDDVFCEGVGPPIRPADNLGTPESKDKTQIILPPWFALENEQEGSDQETGGTQEPPATPVGKDELALRRHRFFSELLTAAQNVIEHKVHFDPMGPVIADAVVEPEPAHELETLVIRLEDITTRLENVYLPVQKLLKQNYNSSNSLVVTVEQPEIDTAEPIVTMSVQGYERIVDGPLALYISTSQKIGGDVASHSLMVKEAFQTQLEYVKLASQSKQPSQSDINNLIQPTGQCIMKIQGFREKNRASQYFNHLSAISESIPALAWVAVTPAPAPHIKEMNDAGQFYTNRVLKDWKEKDIKHKDWVNSWIQTLTELQAYVKQHHTTGLVWAGKGTIPSGCPLPPPPPPQGPPLPPAPLCDLSAGNDGNNDRSALFAQINQGENITRGLKKVTDEMQTHKNPILREGPAPFKTPASSTVQGKPAATAEKSPSFVRDGKKWLIEFQKGNHNLLVDGAEMNNVVYLFKCTDSTVTVKGKINSITLDSCKKTSVVFDSLVSCIEFINCQSVQMQVLGKVPTISIDKTDGCQVYLSKDSLDVEIVSSKSSEMNILVPKPNGEYVEYPVPEQFKTMVVPGKGLSTIIVENKG